MWHQPTNAMQIKHTLLALLCFSFSFSYGQMPDTFGQLTHAEKTMTAYEKDPEANAVVLYERGDNYFKVVNRRIRLIKEYHGKIKIFNEKAFDQGTIEIQLYHTSNSAEKLTKLKAVTHNEGQQHNVLPSEVFTTDLTEKWREKKFTFPKLQPGSIIEYSYTIETAFTFNLTGWNFQTSIPVIYSEFNAKIPGNWTYNRSLTGPLKLDVNDASIKKYCFQLEGVRDPADCEVLKYTMKDVPAFKAEEDYMLAASNYISRIDFELSQYQNLDGTTDKYTKTWKDVDKEFRGDKDIGRQLSKKNFFESNVDKKLLTEGDDLTRAKNIYKFVQNHYSWNEEYGIYGKARVKNAFEEKRGNVLEINMSLINLLNAANIKSNLMLIATRSRSLPKKIHPVMSDFNYGIAKINIEGKDYLLDATDKYNAFGLLPYRALNHYGRVMDFKNDSYWQDIKPETNNKYQVRAQIKFNLEENKATGMMDMINQGYEAVRSRRAIDKSSEEEYLENWEEMITGDFNIIDYNLIEERSHDTQVSERFNFEIDQIENGDMIYFNPFLIRFFEKNPFTLEKRNYPVDFGYQRSYKYQIGIFIPEGYKVHELPENVMVKLGENFGLLKFQHLTVPNQIQISFDLTFSSYFEAKDYEALKKVFEHVTDIQNNSLVIFKKE